MINLKKFYKKRRNLEIQLSSLVANNAAVSAAFDHCFKSEPDHLAVSSNTRKV